ncbi:MAG: L-2-amino-thiazoline-4-carboxylic acid hydrolase, partial [Candidatus Omnitrophica bacterium]|nr:L-2-amino-thiazoline-4-carboxylic acid hydrolase [Candidatus Omnitrophota bacterium]
EFMRAFDKVMRPMGKILTASYGKPAADEISKKARSHFEELIPEMPFIGNNNIFLNNLMGGFMFLALYEVLKERGVSMEEAGKICYAIGEAQFAGVPKFLRNLLGKMSFSKRTKDAMKNGAELSKKRLYPDDFLFDYIEGNGLDFEFGCDILKCPICESFRKRGAGSFAPYVCDWDIAISKALGTGLVRTMTLAEGRAKCDFRFSRQAKNK